MVPYRSRIVSPFPFHIPSDTEELFSVPVVARDRPCDAGQGPIEPVIVVVVVAAHGYLAVLSLPSAEELCSVLEDSPCAPVRCRLIVERIFELLIKAAVEQLLRPVGQTMQ